MSNVQFTRDEDADVAVETRLHMRQGLQDQAASSVGVRPRKLMPQRQRRVTRIATPDPATLARRCQATAGLLVVAGAVGLVDTLTAPTLAGRHLAGIAVLILVVVASQIQTRIDVAPGVLDRLLLVAAVAAVGFQFDGGFSALAVWIPLGCALVVIVMLMAGGLRHELMSGLLELAGILASAAAISGSFLLRAALIPLLFVIAWKSRVAKVAIRSDSAITTVAMDACVVIIAGIGAVGSALINGGILGFGFNGTICAIGFASLLMRLAAVQAVLRADVYRSGMVGASAPMAELVERGEIVASNPALETWLGCPPPETLSSIMDRSEWAKLNEAIREATDTGRSAVVQVELRGSEDRLLVAMATVSLLSGSTEDSWMVVLDDRTSFAERDAAHEAQLRQLHRQTLSDPLTGLANRQGILEELGRQLQMQTATVLFLDLDGFKGINDRYGHAAGDAILVEIGKRLLRLVRADITVGRLGGDEFVVVHSGHPWDSERIVELVNTISQPMAYGYFDLAVGASVGVASGARGSDPEVVLKQADSAMYVMKRRRRGEGDPDTEPAAQVGVPHRVAPGAPERTGMPLPDSWLPPQHGAVPQRPPAPYQGGQPPHRGPLPQRPPAPYQGGQFPQGAPSPQRPPAPYQGGQPPRRGPMPPQPVAPRPGALGETRTEQFRPDGSGVQQHSPTEIGAQRHQSVAGTRSHEQLRPARLGMPPHVQALANPTSGLGLDVQPIALGGVSEGADKEL